MASVLALACGSPQLDADAGQDGPAIRDGGTRPDGGRAEPRVCGPRDGECVVSDSLSCGVGQTCVLRATRDPDAPWTTRCGIEGPSGESEGCSDGYDCRTGLVCDPSTSTCRHACCTSEDCLDGWACLRLPRTDIGVCRRDDACVPPLWGCPPDLGCGASEPFGCPDGRECMLWEGAALCLPPGPGVEGHPCGSPLECGPGLTCSIGGGGCVRMCLTEVGDAGCGSFRECIAAHPAQLRYGVCEP